MNQTAQGIVSLVGSDEFLPAMLPTDSILLSRIGAPARVVVLPTASAPDGPGVPEHWARMGVDHFEALGASVDSVMLLTRADAEHADLAARIAAANVVYLSDGKPHYLRDTACWRAIRGVFDAGGIVAGGAAGAMVLGAHLVDLPRGTRTMPGLGLVPGIAVIPRFDAHPRWSPEVIARLARTVTVVGVDGSTALVGRPGDWQALGMGKVTVIRAGRRQVYRTGAAVPL